MPHRYRCRVLAAHFVPGRQHRLCDDMERGQCMTTYDCSGVFLDLRQLKKSNRYHDLAGLCRHRCNMWHIGRTRHDGCDTFHGVI